MAPITKTHVLAALTILFAGCADPGSDADSGTAVGTAAPAGSAGVDYRIDADSADAVFREHVLALADDVMEGRSPASAGEELAVAYLIDAYRQAGLKPPPGGDYRQAVPLVGVTPTAVTNLEITGADENTGVRGRAWTAVLWTKRLMETSSIDDSAMVFVGYGVVAPEYDWNDYAGVDVKGKTVVVLVNDPGFATGDSEFFNGNAMTYYGRWTYKYEEAARQGAAGVIIVHESEAAGYPWQVVTGSWSGEQFDLVAEDRNLGRAAIESWISPRCGPATLCAGRAQLRGAA